MSQVQYFTNSTQTGGWVSVIKIVYDPEVCSVRFISGKLLVTIRRPMKDLHVLFVSVVQPFHFLLRHTVPVECQVVPQFSDMVRLERVVFSHFS